MVQLLVLFFVVVILPAAIAVRTTRNGREPEVVREFYDDFQTNAELASLYGPEYAFEQARREGTEHWYKKWSKDGVAFRRKFGATIVDRKAIKRKLVGVVVVGIMVKK